MILIRQTARALGPGRTASFSAAGGVTPYVWSIAPGGAGGAIDSNTGVYTAPSVLTSDPAKAYDLIIATDSSLDQSQSRILVGDPLKLFCEIIQSEMGLADGRVYLFDQKIPQPKDSGIYIAVSVLSDRPFGNTNRAQDNGGGLESQQYVSTVATLGLDIISKSTEALDRRMDVILAIGSTYSQQQQEANAFYISKLPAGRRFVNLSAADGAAIPYRFHIDVNIQYSYSKNTSIAYFDDFSNDETINS